MIKAGMIKAVILDWAGTIVDHGCLAPVDAFRRAFAARGLAVTEAQARAPMGLAKRDHIRAVFAQAGRAPTEADLDAVFALFEPMTTAAAAARATLIPGAAATLAWLRDRGIRIGSTTGYTRPVMDALAPLAAAQGYAPEVILCAGDVPEGRPAPLMMHAALARMDIAPPAAVVKLDDTTPGIAEGRNAGTWAVGVALTGNAAGLDAPALAALADADRETLRTRATQALRTAGAHLVIDGIAQLPDAIVEIERRIAAGARPA